MRVSLTLTEAESLASALYAGDSQPLTVPKPAHRPLDCNWWRAPGRIEGFNSERHRGALGLYLEIARHSMIPLPEFCFPSSFDFTGGATRNPDKGFVKMCLNAAPPIANCRMLQGHLVFDLSADGRAVLEDT
jgi:hypothetical protein